MTGVEAAAVDTTARGFFRSKRSADDLEMDIAAALDKKKLKVKKLSKAKIPAAAEVVHLSVKGLG